MSGRWRRRPTGLPRAATPAVGRLLLEGALPLLAAGNTAAYAESVDYTARRLAKLRVPLHAIGEGLRAQVLAARPLLERSYADHSQEACAALDQFQQAVYLRVVRAYDEVQRGALQALLGVLDAELEARNLHDLLERLLTAAARTFAARWGGLLLMNGEGRLEYAALYGLERRLVCPDIPPGRFFQTMLSARRPGFVLDAANDPGVAQPYFRALDIKTVWAAPLARAARRPPTGAAAPLTQAVAPMASTVGVLHLDFDRVYGCLPQERDLLLAFARRSSLAIERARLIESLAASHARVRHLSRELLRAQENERRRISRDLHDAAAQVMMATRLHLQMARRLVVGRPAEAPIAQGLASVDAGIRELRRIIRDLTPLGLSGGLAAAMRR
ncbi:MAG: histidine kinase, partial [Terriglobales bacterium]